LQALNSDGDHNLTGCQFSIASTGLLAYAPGGILPNSQDSLVWVDHKGVAKPVAPLKAPIESPRLSPDGRRIGYTTKGTERRVWVYDLDRGVALPITTEGLASWVHWTPDGLRMVFTWLRSDPANLYWQPANSSAPMERLTDTRNGKQAPSSWWQAPGSWTPDGATMSFVDASENRYDIMLLHMPDRKVRPFLNSRFAEFCPMFSPDGRWMAYMSDRSGRREVYVQPFPGPGGLWQISSEGGGEPRWSRNGKQLFYRRADQVLVVDVQTGSGFSAGKPRLLFEQPGYGMQHVVGNWDVSVDGKRFLMVKLEERKPKPVTELILVQNWFEELKRLAPGGKQ
jgi:dipeptidyl aminopeptidase/acylaminoacyl peptidase